MKKWMMLPLLLAIGWSGSQAQSWYDQGLVAHYTFDGAGMIDSSSSQMHLTDSMNVEPTMDRHGNPNGALYFKDGTGWMTGTSVHLPDSMEQRSFSLWINVKDTVGVASFPFFYGRLAPGRGNGLGMFSDGRLFYGAFLANLETSFSIPFGHWIHVGLTFDSDTAKIYIGGMLAASGLAGGGTWFTENLNPELNFGILGRVFGGGSVPMPVDFYDGSIDDFRAYDRELNAVEIERLARDSFYTPAPDTNTLGVSTPKSEPLVVYPNPTSEVIYVTHASPSDHFVVINANGQIVLEPALHLSALDVRSLEPGIYMLRQISADGSLRFTRFVKAGSFRP